MLIEKMKGRRKSEGTKAQRHKSGETTRKEAKAEIKERRNEGARVEAMTEERVARVDS